MIWRAEQRGAWDLLGAMLEERGVSPCPAAARLPGGKPYFPARPHLHFNLSHSGDWALCALAERPVGCDIELVRPRRKDFPAYVLDERELGWFRGRGSRWEDFYTLWTLKEARVKCTGEGLRRKPRSIPVPLLEPGERAVWEGFTFTALAGEGWGGAVCLAPEGAGGEKRGPQTPEKGQKRTTPGGQHRV